MLNVNATGIKATDSVLGTHEVDLSVWQNLKDPSDPSKLLFPYGLCSAGTVHDEITATQAIRRIGSVDLGTLTWNNNYTGQGTTHYLTACDNHGIPIKNSTLNMLCPKYRALSYDSVWRYNTGISLATNKIMVYDPNYNTSGSATAFKTAMSGVMLYYELATPIVVDLPRRQDYSYPVSLQTVESVVPSNAVVSVGETKPQTAPIITTNTYSGVYSDDCKPVFVEYIESTKQQAVAVPNDIPRDHTITISCDFQAREITDGERQYFNVHNWQLYSSSGSFKFYSAGGTYIITALNTSQHNIYYTRTPSGGIVYSFDNSTPTSLTQTNILERDYIPIFGFSNVVSSTSSSMRLYFMKVYDNSELVYDLAPCLSTEPQHYGEACIYDKVRHMYIYNVSDVPFLYGSVL